ncbi:uncharacterized protein PHACADRAFT_263561 [Phanerochaete carnosa HHB-10118-sp]|uniref:Lectin n=1 Tax=Phanerochaete carnosa (strain HHB-10118-sp) TaxID=650164 RepID=K5VXA2_PHACS|nr:uncharacterized protein PHACADRAFT_263561 [Phanerochaete carnosa HHB-10118-sp]EKM51430.1 hypothetical protein PHACADRAFT_263561 [Phanerochaete carnosa HHB-10118-sp]
MSYTITVRVYQTSTNAFFRVVEKIVWHEANGGTWDESCGEHILTLGGSGTSGALRFESDTGENFLAAFGVHSYKRWCDIVTGLEPRQTGTLVLGEYYTDRGAVQRAYMRERQAASYGVESLGDKPRGFNVAYTVADGKNLRANIVIG